MNSLKVFFLFIALNIFVKLVFAQSNNVYMTVTPSPYPDMVTKPAVVIAPGQERGNMPQEQIHYESKTVVPESKLSIGKASVVTTTPAGENATQSVTGDKSKVNYSEQKIEKQESPVNNPSLNPK